MSGLEFKGTAQMEAPADCDAGYGRRVWLQQAVQPTDHVVDLGGVGTMLAGWHPGQVTAVDDLSGFGPGHRLLAHQFVLGDVEHLEQFADQTFDVALLCEVLEHVPDPPVAIREACRVAKRVLFSSPLEQQWTNGLRYHVSGHMRFYFPHLMARDLALAGATGWHGVLRFGSWAFCFGEVRRAA